MSNPSEAVNPTPEPSEPSPGLRVRSADEESPASLARLLPELRSLDCWKRAFVAERVGEKGAVGAAALVRGPRQYRVLIKPGAPEARSAAFRALWAAVREEAERERAPAVLGWYPLVEGSAGAALWAESGFVPTGEVITYETKTETVRNEVERVWSRLQERGRVPPGAKIVGLREAPLAEVARLRLAHIGGVPGLVFAQICGDAATGNLAPELSCVAMCDGAAAGVWLAGRPKPGTVLVDAVVVAPGRRAGWANALVRLEGARRALDHGLERVIFQAGPQHRDTHNNALRLGARPIQKSHWPFFALRADEAAEQLALAESGEGAPQLAAEDSDDDGET